MADTTDRVIRAAIEVADAAFVDQRLVVGTALHEPIQRLIDALSACGRAGDIRCEMDYELRTRGATGGGHGKVR